jgi:hypothetical protein
MRAGAYDGVEAFAVVGAGSAALQETVLVTETPQQLRWSFRK